MSLDLSVYLDYMAVWADQTPDKIQPIIDEHNLFLNLGSYDTDTPINNEFNTLVALATQVRDDSIAADAIQIAADGAAAASIFSFGLGMAAFVLLEANKLIVDSQVSKLSDALNAKLSTVDTDIANATTKNLQDYVAIYKNNNTFIASLATTGTNNQLCRTILMQFIAQIQRAGQPLTTDNFLKWAQSARVVYKSAEIQDVYNALDTLNLGDTQNQDAINQCMATLAAFKIPGIATATEAIQAVQGISLGIMGKKMKIANDKIKAAAKTEGIPEEQVSEASFENLDAVGKVAGAITVIMSVVDIIFQVYAIVDLVKKYQQLVDQLNGPIKTNYINYFNGMKDSSAAYRKAIGLPPL